MSVIKMHVLSRDQLVRVADLCWCNRHDLKRHVKVCAGLFSTTTKSERFHEPMVFSETTAVSATLSLLSIMIAPKRSPRIVI